VEKLVEHFIEHLIVDIDFSTPLDPEKLKELLDDSEESDKLIERLSTEEDVEEFILDIADGLKDKVEQFIRQELLNEINEFASS
jgi:hypothetical protein